MLEEYNTLREELLLHIKLERQVLALSGTVAFVAFTFCAKFATVVPYDLYGVILLLLLTPIFLVYRAESFTIAKIASYIENCIESKVDGLNWTGHNINKPARRSWRVLDLSSTATGAIYFLILLLLSWGLPLYLKGKYLSIPATVAMAALSAVYLVNAVLLLSYRHYRRYWDSIWHRKSHAIVDD